jgi:hypothetical protein
MTENAPVARGQTVSAAARQSELEASLHEKQSVLAGARQFVADTEAEMLRLEGAVLAIRDRVSHEAAIAQVHTDLEHQLDQARAELESLRPAPTDPPTDPPIATDATSVPGA